MLVFCCFNFRLFLVLLRNTRIDHYKDYTTINHNIYSYCISSLLSSTFRKPLLFKPTFTTLICQKLRVPATFFTKMHFAFCRNNYTHDAFMYYLCTVWKIYGNLISSLTVYIFIMHATFYCIYTSRHIGITLSTLVIYKIYYIFTINRFKRINNWYT